MKTHWQIFRVTLANLLVLPLLGLLPGSSPTQAAVLTTVPMQGGMLMPSVSYHADSDRASVDLSSIGLIAQLTPLMVSHPQDQFDPSAPWFDDLDPSRQGLAFSRRYGFNMSPDSDLLPENRQLWIRKTAGSPNLNIYDYNASSSPKRWVPILGTAGSSHATYWSGLMWHVGVAAPAGTNRYFATFEVFVVNTTTGQEVPNSSSGPFRLEWTSVPDGRPPIGIAASVTDGLVLTWPMSATNWTLVTATNLTETVWQPVSQSAVVAGGQSRVIIGHRHAQQFYRLKREP